MTKNTLIDRDHPIWFLHKLAEKIPPDIRFSFEAYKRINRTYDQGDIGKVLANLTGAELTDSWDELQEYATGMCKTTEAIYGKEYEIGIRSKADGPGHLIYVPMIDFVDQPTHDQIYNLVDSLIPIIGNEYFWFYNSGRSLHAYVETMVSPLKYKRFNEHLQKFPGIVDTKWVSHTQSKGYGILRWSAITSYHAQLPRFKEKIMVS